MPSSTEKRAEQQRLRRAAARAAAAAATATTPAASGGEHTHANLTNFSHTANDHEETRDERLTADWQLDRPPRLCEDFGGEGSRAAYEVAREQWYRHINHAELPPFNPSADVEDQHKQISAFQIPVREEIAMVYNTTDGNTAVVNDLSSAPKV